MDNRFLLLVPVALALVSIPAACNRDSLATAGDDAKAKSDGTHQVAGATHDRKPREKGPTTVVVLTEQNFAEGVLKADRPVLVDFYADWCKPCRALAPNIAYLARKYDGEVIFGKLNTDLNKRLSNQYRVRGLPTLIIFKDGQPADRMMGFHDASAIEARIEKVRS